ncbi:MAG TPA: condensation domain-containing protein, partial [Blastocatellia bacterium]
MQKEILKGFRLSPQQKQIWMSRQDGPAPQMACAILLRGDLKIDALKQALQNVVDRHQILRTTFHKRPGTKLPVQVINENAAPLWEEIDLSDRSVSQREAELDERLHRQDANAIENERGSLLSATLIRWTARERVLLVSLSPLCSDPRTLKNLVREIGRSYQASVERTELSDEPVQYAQFSKWQNELLEDEGDEGKGYWLKQDFSIYEATSLPIRRRRIGETQEQYEVLTSRIAPALAASLEALAGECGVSVKTLLFSCWQALLWRYTGQSPVVISTAFDCRSYEELEEMLGPCAKHIPLRHPLKEGLRFRDLAEKVHDSINEAAEYQDYFSWEQIDGSESTLSRYRLSYHELPESRAAADVTFSLYKQRVIAGKFEIEMSYVRSDDSLFAEICYDPSQFSAENISHLSRNLQTILKNAVGNPDAMIDALEILSEPDRRQLLVEFNNTDTAFNEGGCIHQLFERVAELMPAGKAAIYGGEHLTYEELNSKANQLARHLRRQGVGPESLVGILMDRGLQVLVALLGVLKAGGAYVPLDPGY